MADSKYIYSYRGQSPSSEKNPKEQRKIFWVIFVGVTGIIILSIYLIVKLNRKETSADSQKPPDAAVSEPSDKRDASLTKNPDLNKAEEALKKEDFMLARNLALKVISSSPATAGKVSSLAEQVKEDDPLWEKAAVILNSANTALLLSDIPCPEKQLYTIKPGDNLVKIAKYFNTTIEAIQRSNGMDPANPTIFPGRTLNIFTGKWLVKVSKKRFRLYLYNGESLFKVYNIGIGKQGRTPTGVFEVNLKQEEPAWYFEGKTIPYGSKENVLGTRWMALKPVEGTDPKLRGYGIHGTWEVETLGTPSSNGCVRMLNKEVEELYSIIPLNTKVIIKD